MLRPPGAPGWTGWSALRWRLPGFTRLRENFLTVTPGIRFADGMGKDDQKRVMTPADAGKAGSDYIVVGRPITGAEDPVAAWKRCLREFLGSAE